MYVGLDELRSVPIEGGPSVTLSEGLDVPWSTTPWDAQLGATLYEVVRATAPDFPSGCTTFVTTDPLLIDPDAPAFDVVSHYLVRSLAPHPGSHGQDSSGIERPVPCVP